MGARRLRVRTHPPCRPAEASVRFISLDLGERAMARVLLDGTLESALAQGLLPGTRSPTSPTELSFAGDSEADALARAEAWVRQTFAVLEDGDAERVAAR